jgi:hypothetical protein
MKGTASTRKPETQGDPEANDFQYFGLDFRIRRVEVRLEIVEAMEIPLLRHRIVAPGGLLYAGKHHTLLGVGRTLF